MSLKLICPNCGPIRTAIRKAGAPIELRPGPIPGSRCFRCKSQLHAVEADDFGAVKGGGCAGLILVVGGILVLFLSALAAA